MLDVKSVGGSRVIRWMAGLAYGNRVSASALAAGQRVFVVGAVVGGADNARLIIIRG